METIKKLGLAALILVGSLYSCEKSDLRPETQQLKTEEKVALPMWRISSFQWHNGEINNDFDTYLFKFQQDGSISALHEDQLEYGKWERAGDILKIEFQTRPLNLLNNKWTVLEHSNTIIKLGGLSPYDNTAEILVFENVNYPLVQKN